MEPVLRTVYRALARTARYLDRNPAQKCGLIYELSEWPPGPAKDAVQLIFLGEASSPNAVLHAASDRGFFYKPPRPGEEKNHNLMACLRKSWRLAAQPSSGLTQVQGLDNALRALRWLSNARANTEFMTPRQPAEPSLLAPVEPVTLVDTSNLVSPGHGQTPTIQPGMLLLSHPQLTDEFYRSVLLVTHHGPDGTRALILNRPFPPGTMGLPRVGLSSSGGNVPLLHFGGPVRLLPDRIYVLHTQPKLQIPRFKDRNGREGVRDLPLTELLDSEMQTVHLSEAAPSPLLRLAAAQAGGQIKLCWGVAGWVPYQLETELAANTWIVVKGTSRHVFDEEHCSWSRILSSLGGEYAHWALIGTGSPSHHPSSSPSSSSSSSSASASSSNPAGLSSTAAAAGAGAAAAVYSAQQGMLSRPPLPSVPVDEEELLETDEDDFDPFSETDIEEETDWEEVEDEEEWTEVTEEEYSEEEVADGDNDKNGKY